MDEEIIERLNKEGREISPLIRYWNRKGEPIGLGDYFNLGSQDSYRRVRLTQIFDLKGCPVTISTIWLGCDLRFLQSDSDAPLIFETKMWKCGEDPCEDKVYRHRTEDEACAAHEILVGEIQASMKADQG